MRKFNYKRAYVDSSLHNALAPLMDYESVRYANNDIGEYVRIADSIGGVAYLDETGRSESDILKDVSMIVLGMAPKTLIHDRAELRKIAPLFK